MRVNFCKRVFVSSIKFRSRRIIRLIFSKGVFVSKISYRSVVGGSRKIIRLYWLISIFRNKRRSIRVLVRLLVGFLVLRGWEGC